MALMARLMKLLKNSEDLKRVFMKHLQGHCALVELLLHSVQAPIALLGKMTAAEISRHFSSNIIT